MLIERDAIRAILMTAAREVLAMRIRTPSTDNRIWIASGGGLDPGESVAAGSRRELREELGLVDFTVETLFALSRSRGYGWSSCNIAAPTTRPSLILITLP